MALFTVELTDFIVVVADDASHAYEMARDHRTAACMDSQPEYNVVGEVKTLGELPGDWDGDCLPYGGDGKATLGEILGS